MSVCGSDSEGARSQNALINNHPCTVQAEDQVIDSLTCAKTIAHHMQSFTRPTCCSDCNHLCNFRSACVVRCTGDKKLRAWCTEASAVYISTGLWVLHSRTHLMTCARLPTDEITFMGHDHIKVRLHFFLVPWTPRQTCILCSRLRAILVPILLNSPNKSLMV